MTEVAQGIASGDEIEGRPDRCFQGLFGPNPDTPQVCLDLAERLLDRIEVRRVARQKLSISERVQHVKRAGHVPRRL